MVFLLFTYLEYIMAVKPNPTLVAKFADKFNFADEKKLIVTLKATAFKVKKAKSPMNR